MLDTINILEGSTFVTSDRLGDIDGTPATPHGFSRWTRASSGGSCRWATASSPYSRPRPSATTARVLPSRPDRDDRRLAHSVVRRRG